MWERQKVKNINSTDQDLIYEISLDYFKGKGASKYHNVIILEYYSIAALNNSSIKVSYLRQSSSTI